MSYFVVHYSYFSCMSLLQDFTFFNITEQYVKFLENSTFGVYRAPCPGLRLINVVFRFVYPKAHAWCHAHHGQVLVAPMYRFLIVS